MGIFMILRSRRRGSMLKNLELISWLIWGSDWWMKKWMMMVMLVAWSAVCWWACVVLPWQCEKSWTAEAEEGWVGAVDESCLPVKMGQWYQNVLVVKNMDGIVIIFSANIYQYFTQLYIYSYLFNSMGWDGIYIFFSDAKIDILCKQQDNLQQIMVGIQPR